MAVELWAVSMLLLLLVLPPPAGASPAPQHLCGSHLVDALYLVCGSRGFFYSPHRNTRKRDLPQPLAGLLTRRGSLETRLWKGPSEKSRDKPKVKRGIVEQCCHKPCSLYDLEGYCD